MSAIENSIERFVHIFASRFVMVVKARMKRRRGVCGQWARSTYVQASSTASSVCVELHARELRTAGETDDRLRGGGLAGRALFQRRRWPTNGEGGKAALKNVDGGYCAATFQEPVSTGWSPAEVL
jgi:hypothetical protein